MSDKVKAAAAHKQEKRSAEKLREEWAHVQCCSVSSRRPAVVKSNHRPAASYNDWPAPGRCVA